MFLQIVLAIVAFIVVVWPGRKIAAWIYWEITWYGWEIELNNNYSLNSKSWYKLERLTQIEEDSYRVTYQDGELRDIPYYKTKQITSSPKLRKKPIPFKDKRISPTNFQKLGELKQLEEEAEEERKQLEKEIEEL